MQTITLKHGKLKRDVETPEIWNHLQVVNFLKTNSPCCLVFSFCEWLTQKPMVRNTTWVVLFHWLTGGEVERASRVACFLAAGVTFFVVVNEGTFQL